MSYFFFEDFLAAFLAAGFLAAFFFAAMCLPPSPVDKDPIGSIGFVSSMLLRRGQRLSHTYLLCNPTGFAADPHL